MKHIVFLTGAGISVESGLSTFRGSDGLWNNHRIEDVCTVDAWHRSPQYVNSFYAELRQRLPQIQPNEAHRLVAEFEEHYRVTVVTQNVDDLHERAGSTNIIHLHGSLLKMCSSFRKEDESQWVTLTLDNLEVGADARATDGSLLRPYIVWFGEDVPRMEEAIDAAEQADLLVVVGTSLNVYPAANLVNFVKQGTPIVVIDPEANKLICHKGVIQLAEKATAGMEALKNLLKAGAIF